MSKKPLQEMILAIAAAIVLEFFIFYFKLITFHDIFNGLITLFELPEIWTSIPSNVKVLIFIFSSFAIIVIIKIIINQFEEKKVILNEVSIEEFNSMKAELISKKNLLNTLGIIGLTERKDTPITMVSESIKKTYEWVGLSAINELGPGAADNTEILEYKLDDNIKLCYTILSPDDKLRIKQSAIWENHEPLDIKKHIELSVEKLRYLKNRNEHQVKYYFAKRIPWLRVTKIDKDLFQVAHYDKFNLNSKETSKSGYGCGFIGSILLIGNDDNNGKEPLLYTWLNDFILVEKQNLLIDELYATVSKEYCINANSESVIKIITSEKYKELNNEFNHYFKWYDKKPQLRREEIILAIDYVLKKYGLNYIKK